MTRTATGADRGVPRRPGRPAPAAPLGRRAAAYVVDCAATSLVGGVLVLAGIAPALPGADEATTVQDAAAGAADGTLVLTGLGLIAVLALVQWWLHGTRGWTLGRRMLGLRTVDIDTGRPIGLGRVLLRGLVVAAGSLAFGVGQLVVLASPLFDESDRRRGWHDRAVRSEVVDVRGLVSAERLARWSAADRVAPSAITGLPRPHAGTSSGAPAGPARPAEVPSGVDLQRAAPPGPGTPPAPAEAPTPSAPVAPAGAVRDGVPSLGRRLAQREQTTGGLVMPPFATPGLAPDMDTRVLPAVRVDSSGVPEQSGPVAHAAPPPWRPPAPPAAAASPVAPAPHAAAASPDAPVAPGSVAEPGLPVSRLEDGLELTVRRWAPTAPATTGTPAAPSVPQWRIRLSDGRVLPLDRPLLVGRNPDTIGAATGVRVEDPGRSVSKTHLQLGVDEGGAWVADRGSTNGTLVTLPDGQRIVCLADRRVRLPRDSVVTFGEHHLTVELAVELT